MKSALSIIAKTAAVLSLFGILALTGCAPQTGSTAGSYEEGFRFVPRIHVQENSFGVSSTEYSQCHYDRYYDGYWCRVY